MSVKQKWLPEIIAALACLTFSCLILFANYSSWVGPAFSMFARTDAPNSRFVTIDILEKKETYRLKISQSDFKHITNSPTNRETQKALDQLIHQNYKSSLEDTEFYELNESIESVTLTVWHYEVKTDNLVANKIYEFVVTT